MAYAEDCIDKERTGNAVMSQTAQQLGCVILQLWFMVRIIVLKYESIENLERIDYR